MLELNKLKCQRVQVVDTLNNTTTLYASISDAALAIGCVHSTVSKALSHLKEKGTSKLIKKRFQVQPQ